MIIVKQELYYCKVHHNYVYLYNVYNIIENIHIQLIVLMEISDIYYKHDYRRIQTATI